MVKKILIVALAEKWTGISRLPGGLKRAGFDVYAYAPKNSYLAKTSFLNGRMLYPTFTYARSKVVYLGIILSILRLRPDLVVPGDEDALLALQALAKFPLIGKKITSSLPGYTDPSVLLSKSKFVAKCAKWGVRVPKNIEVKNLQEALTAAPRLGFPLVVKYDFGYGASGVEVVHNEEQLIKSLSSTQKVSLVTKIKRVIKTLLFVVPKDDENGLSLQQYISGQVGLAPFCAQNGAVFAANPMLKHKTYPGATGPSSVVVGVDNQEIHQAILTVAKNLSYTGFGSLDFIVEQKTGEAYVIELNPRPVPTVHFDSDLCAQDLCASFYKGLNKQFKPHDSGAPLYKSFTIALFPNEKRRDPQSPYLTQSYHDIPKDDEVLMEALDRN
ncbi:ATP-binding protein [Bdellovibrio reynosensis]|uniref:ATP-grasp domain-containing protein n=1 Tax=Bdellovibrio reynosensis TaxID=2835041 RepID=A0ABY4CI01_9BACT|nr:ATP-grasp domain-containing protein [Bdellovibrio reynosensis]UOF01840.1 ATP-grasp domain-containing protein [Bdellovibrio reynosensis]